jgi:chemotaxis protein MotB
MLKQALIVASILSVALVGSIVAYSGHRQKQEFAKVQAELAAMKAAAQEQAAQAQAQTAALQQELTNSQSRIEALIKEKEQVTRAQSQMEEQMRTALQSKDVTISELQGKLTVNILDRVLFDSGEADLKPEGAAVLTQLAGVLTQHTNRQIYVIGHTDNVPIRAGPFSRYSSNWELSTARATAAVRHLVDTAGVSPKMLAAVGYGEHHPAADNSTAEGRARNRRIAIVILPEQFNPLDMNTNAPPENPAPPALPLPAPEPATNSPAAPAPSVP